MAADKMVTDLQLSTFSDVETLLLLVSILFLKNFTFYARIQNHIILLPSLASSFFLSEPILSISA